MNEMDNIISKLSKGRAVLFVGSGFSMDALSISKDDDTNEEESMPIAFQLTKMLLNDLGEDFDSNELDVVADYYIHRKGEDALVSLLKDRLTVKEITVHQKIVCSLDWLRVYTTNYDDVIEKGYLANNKYTTSVDTSFNIKDYQKQENICVHLNGMLSNLKSDDLNNSFKLTNSSYVSPESFLNSQWSFLFRKDLERASIIIFIGYSLYDMDIKKVLNENKFFKDKIYFITDEKIKKSDEFRLSNFGKILKIGVQGFAEILEDNKEKINDDSSVELKILTKFESNYKVNSELTDDQNIRDMLILGRYNHFIIEEHFNKNFEKYFIKRSSLEICYEFINDNNNVFVKSKLGNGKTFFLDLFKTYAYSLGEWDIYALNSDGINVFDDLEALAKNGKKSIILVDNYIENEDVVNFISNLNVKNLKMIITVRTNDYTRLLHEISKSIPHKNIDLDQLDEFEISNFIDIIDNLGYWGTDASLSFDNKLALIQKKYNSEISSILAGIFDSEEIKNRLNKIFESTKSNKLFEKNLLVIFILKKIGIRAKRSLVSDLARDINTVYSSEFENNEFCKNVFDFKSDEIKGISSILANFLVSKFFHPNVVIDNFLDVAEHINETYGRSRPIEHNEVFRAMLKFSFIESCLTDKTKLPSLMRYYQELKKRISWLDDEPSFWLQYAMCHISLHKYTDAQKLLDTAYALTNKRTEYDTSSLDNQQIRLWLLKCNQETDGNKILSTFMNANNKLRNSKGDIYKYRRLLEYVSFFENNYEKLTKDGKRKFKEIIYKILKDIEQEREEDELFVYTKTRNDVESKLISIHSKI